MCQNREVSKTSRTVALKDQDTPGLSSLMEIQALIRSESFSLFNQHFDSFQLYKALYFVLCAASFLCDLFEPVNFAELSQMIKILEKS